MTQPGSTGPGPSRTEHCIIQNFKNKFLPKNLPQAQSRRREPGAQAGLRSKINWCYLRIILLFGHYVTGACTHCTLYCFDSNSVQSVQKVHAPIFESRSVQIVHSVRLVYTLYMIVNLNFWILVCATSHFGSQQCTFIVSQVFTSVSLWRANQKLILMLSCTGSLMIILNFIQELWNP